MVVKTAWNIPITVACFPIFLRSLSLNSFPIENAIKPSATSDIKEKDLICSKLLKPKPLTPILPIINGPNSKPAIK